MTTGQIRIGISGWNYRAWRGDFYPQGLPQRLELEYAAERMSSVEINGSFYSLQRPTSYARWRDATPDGFVFAVKGSRFITHMRRLGDVETALANFWASGVLALGPKLGPVLWQLPESFTFDADRLASFFALLPRTTRAAAALARRHDDKLTEDRTYTKPGPDAPIRHVLEPRHDSFDTVEAEKLLRDNDIGTVYADTAGHFPVIDRDTSDVRYVRLHGHTKLYESEYSPGLLDDWAFRCREWSVTGRDVHVYFDNDAHGAAPWDAVSLLQRLSPG